METALEEEKGKDTRLKAQPGHEGHCRKRQEPTLSTILLELSAEALEA